MQDSAAGPEGTPGVQGDETPRRTTLWHRLRHGCLWFLDAVGLYHVAAAVDQEAELARFRVYHTEFRRLLNANSSFLSIIAELEELKHGERSFDHGWVKAQALRANVDVYQMVSSLNAISGGRYAALEAKRETISAEFNRRLAITLAGMKVPLLMDLSQIRARDAWLVGGKMANLGEIRNGVGLPTPDGFAVTVEGHHRVVSSAGIALSENALEPRSAEAVTLSVPPEVEEALNEAYSRLSNSLGHSPLLAVRSSALGEDSHVSFAGQFLTALQVPRSGLGGAYLDVLRSLYSPQATHYRRLHGVSEASLAMAVGCIEMIQPLAAGVAYSVDPRSGSRERILIHAVRGLAASLVEGRTSPEVVEVERDGRVTLHTPSHQEVAIRGQDGGGLREETVSAEVGQACVLSDEEASRLAGMVLQLEAHFGAPQDVEWAMDQRRQFWILQSRPLRVLSEEKSEEPPVPGRKVLLSGGEVACPGVGTGPVCHVAENDDLEAFPDGAVLVARRSSPDFVLVMSKARAIITDLGSATGHMAALAREFNIPALVNTRQATATLKPGQMVTLDTRGRRVYEDAVPELQKQEKISGVTIGQQDVVTGTPAFSLLESVAELLIPLRLSRPGSEAFTPEHCLSLHDVARFAHEKSYEEMFQLGGALGDVQQAGVRLDVFLPVDINVFDLGGGIQAPPGTRRIKLAQVTSVPFSALMAGMLDRRIQRFGARPMDVRGLLGIMMRHAVENPEEARTFRDPCYALISDRYLNYTARVGYHFAVVDTYCGLTSNKNYISVLFRGGAAEYERRSRRVRAIAGGLEHHGFAVSVEGDAVYARLSKRDQQETAAHLTMIGRALQFFRQMDAAMNSEESVQVMLKAFLDEDFDFSRQRAGADAPSRTGR